jgi:AcrR family transcriptional regulator
MSAADPTPAPEPRRYHHGDLRGALLAAAESELAEKGVEGFSLRGVAKRAGVSHAAPAHHFRDTAGLLSALAAEGFTRFLAAQQAREAAAAPRPPDRAVAAGLGYVDFALAHPALFRLMFSSERPDFDDETLDAAARAAFRHLLELVADLRGSDDPDDPAALADVTALWAIVHGLADLMQASRILKPLSPTEREALADGVIRRCLPEPHRGATRS